MARCLDNVPDAIQIRVKRHILAQDHLTGFIQLKGPSTERIAGPACNHPARTSDDRTLRRTDGFSLFMGERVSSQHSVLVEVKAEVLQVGTVQVPDARIKAGFNQDFPGRVHPDPVPHGHDMYVGGTEKPLGYKFHLLANTEGGMPGMEGPVQIQLLAMDGGHLHQRIEDLSVYGNPGKEPVGRIDRFPPGVTHLII